ncbi:MAG TPA: HEAT repeat domain-containing protein, partial [Myxococcota bacterium]
QAVKIGALVSLVDVYGADSARIDDAFVKVLDDVDPVVAAQAAERFGARKSDRVVPTLTALANDDDRALDVRSGAFAGLARQRSEASFDALVQVATSTTTPELQVAAAQSLELLCSRWAFAARHEEARGTTLRGKAVAALSSVKWQGAAEVKRQQVLKRLSA